MNVVMALGGIVDGVLLAVLPLYELMMVRFIGYSISAFWLDIILGGRIGSSSRLWDLYVCLPCSTPFRLLVNILAIGMASRVPSLLVVRCFRVALRYSHPRFGIWLQTTCPHVSWTARRLPGYGIRS